MLTKCVPLANVHAVNFTLGIGAFRKQIDQLAAMIESFSGPVIVAGDFNTWNGARASYLERRLADELSLKKVDFNRMPLTRFLDRPLDHVFYRGLVVTRIDAQQTSGSDHNPMWVSFRQPDPR